MENRNHKSVNRFFFAVSFSVVILSFRVVIKELTVMETLSTLFQTFWYLFTISLWVGLVAMFCADAYEEIKKNGSKNINKLYILND